MVSPGGGGAGFAHRVCLPSPDEGTFTTIRVKGVRFLIASFLYIFMI